MKLTINQPTPTTMKATELRIANMLKWEDESDDIVIIDSIISESNGQPSVKYHTPKNKKQSACMLFEFTGIPLTEEWLENFGFKKETAWYRLGKHAINPLLANLYEFKNIPIIEVAYVHSLQNLFYAISGYDLVLLK